MLAALKFFLGQDVAAEEDAGDDPDAEDNTPDAPSKDDVYRAYHKVHAAQLIWLRPLYPSES